jgi:hypothetical protein
VKFGTKRPQVQILSPRPVSPQVTGLSSRPQTLLDYIASIGDEGKVLNMLVGDTQRIWVYADQGYAAPQEVPLSVTHAFNRLVNAGYTRRVLPG